MKKKMIPAFLVAAIVLSSCGSSNNPPPVSNDTLQEESVVTDTSEEKEEIQEPIKETKMELTKNYKTRGNSNPIMTQSYGADPFAMVYDDTVYIYMTADAYEYDANGEIKENSYSKISSIHVVSTKDMKNFTDCGEIPVAGPNGVAKWAKNSWAPAAAWKNIDGRDQFFLYFADNGGGIGVVTADSPTGPFRDPLGHALISRETPNCANVLWLFDPAVLVDDDGKGYIYFGGGVPQDKVDRPGTGRCAMLGDDMISLATEPVAIDVPYLFEDSGIHKFNNKYYYTYCTNWNVPDTALSEFGFSNGQIACMVSDSPLGPFVYQEKILENPGRLCGLYGNNHHAVFPFRDEWYIVYHSRQLEKSQGIEHGYRVTFVNKVNIKEDGTIGTIPQSLEGPAQLEYVNPYNEVSAVCVSQMAGTNAVPASEDIKYGNMILGEIQSGDYTEITGVDFAKGANKVTIKANVPTGVSGKVHVRLDFPGKNEVAVVELTEGKDEFTAELTETVSDVHFLYFVFEGEGYTVSSWKFE